MQYLEIFIENQIKLVATSFILGLIFGAGYDIIRITTILCGLVSFAGKKPVERKGFLPFCVRFFVDLSWAAVLSVSFAVFVYAANDGQFRWFIAASAIGGFALWEAGPGRLVTEAARLLSRFLRALFRAAVIVPGAAVLRFFCRIFSLIWRATGEKIERRIRRARAIGRTEKFRRRLAKDVPFCGEEWTGI